METWRDFLLLKRVAWDTVWSMPAVYNGLSQCCFTPNVKTILQSSSFLILMCLKLFQTITLATSCQKLFYPFILLPMRNNQGPVNKVLDLLFPPTPKMLALQFIFFFGCSSGFPQSWPWHSLLPPASLTYSQQHPCLTFTQQSHLQPGSLWPVLDSYGDFAPIPSPFPVPCPAVPHPPLTLNIFLPS